MWFSQPAVIPGPPTLPDYARTINVKVSSGPDDFSRAMPWRAPGTAPVFGSGCGSGGGGPVSYSNGGNAPPGYKNGQDFLDIPASAQPTVWKRGSVQEVAWAIFANHGPPVLHRQLLSSSVVVVVGLSACLNCRTSYRNPGHDGRGLTLHVGVQAAACLGGCATSPRTSLKNASRKDRSSSAAARLGFGVHVAIGGHLAGWRYLRPFLTTRRECQEIDVAAYRG